MSSANSNEYVRMPEGCAGVDDRWVAPIELGDRIRKVRLLKGLQQQEFAEIIGVARAIVSRWEKNETIPKVPNVIKISETFGVDIQWLLKGKSELVKQLPGN